MNSLYELFEKVSNEKIPKYKRDIFEQLLKSVNSPMIFTRKSGRVDSTVFPELPKRNGQIIVDDIHTEQTK